MSNEGPASEAILGGSNNDRYPQFGHVVGMSYCAVRPPSMTISAPVTKADSSESK